MPCVPSAHATQAVLDGFDVDPGIQAVHVELPLVFVYPLLPQTRHVVLLTTGAYCPRLQSIHCAALVRPTILEYLPVGHAKHDTDIFMFWYVPAIHGEQAVL